MCSWQVRTSMFVSMEVWNLNKTGHLLFVFLLLDLVHTVCMNLELITEVTPYGTNLLTCRYIGIRTVTSVGWYIGSNTSIPLTLAKEGLEYVIHGGIPESFDGYKINYTCDAVKNNYTLEIKQKTPRDDAVLMVFAILDPLPHEKAYVTIYFYESTTTATTPESTTTATTPGDHQKDEFGFRLVIGLAVGIPVSLIIIIGGIVFCIVINFKTKVIIENKDTLRSLKQAKKKVKITAKIGGHWISSVEWIKEKEILYDDDNYSIVSYDGKEKKSSLTIKNLSKTENETYICQAKGRFGFSAQDSITVSFDKKKQRKEKTGLCSKTPQPNRSASCLSHVQSTEKEENPLEESKQKRRKRNKKRQMSDGNPNNEMEELERPPAIHTGPQNKTTKTTSKQTNERPQPLPPVAVIAVEKPKPRPQPTRPENINAKDRNLQERFDSFNNTQGLETVTPQPSRLPPLTSKQETLQEKDASEEKPRKKRKNKKKNGHMNGEKNKIEMEETNKRDSLKPLIELGES